MGGGSLSAKTSPSKEAKATTANMPSIAIDANLPQTGTHPQMSKHSSILKSPDKKSFLSDDYNLEEIKLDDKDLYPDNDAEMTDYIRAINALKAEINQLKLDKSSYLELLNDYPFYFSSHSNTFKKYEDNHNKKLKKVNKNLKKDGWYDNAMKSRKQEEDLTGDLDSDEEINWRHKYFKIKEKNEAQNLQINKLKVQRVKERRESDQRFNDLKRHHELQLETLLKKKEQVMEESENYQIVINKYREKLQRTPH